MSSLSEKRVYSERREEAIAYVASDDGLAKVSVAGDRVGRFSLQISESVRDVAAGNGRLLVATQSDVLVGDTDALIESGFGRAIAVGVGTDELFAAAPDGRIAILEGDRWRTLGTVESPHRFDGEYLAAADGVYRIGSVPVRLGLSNVRDVAANEVLAATRDGVHRAGENGWARVYGGENVTRVAANDEHRHLIDDSSLFEFVGREWQACPLPVDEPVVDVSYGELPYAVTANGTILVEGLPHATPDGGAGWRHTALGLSGCVALDVA